MTAITAASESPRSGDANCSMLRTIPPHRKVAAVDARPIHTRCMSSNIAEARAPKRFVRLRAHPADHAGLQPGPVVRRRGSGRRAQRVADRPRALAALRARRAFLDVRFDRDQLADGQLAIVEGRKPTPDRRTGQEGHTCLSCARRLSRARARRDLTVPTAMPSENPISS